jgi:hypothetical protein
MAGLLSVSVKCHGVMPPLPVVSNYFNQINLLSDALHTFQKNHTEEPVIACKNCNQQLTCGEFFGGLVGRAMRDILDGGSHLEKIQKNLQDGAKILLEGSLQDVTGFMLITANDCGYVCTDCKSTVWK